MKYVFLSHRSYVSVLKLLKTFSFEPVLIPDLPLVDAKTAYHADLSLCILGKTVVCAPSLYENLSNISGYTVIKGDSEPCDPYPNDILYNAAVVGKNIFCRIDKTDKILLEIAAKNGYHIVNVKQGYARCSTLPVGDSALITSDSGIYSEALKIGLDALFVSNKGVLLDGYPNGFIGGCGGFLENKLVFCGDISKHRGYEKIKDFCAEYSVELYFTSEPLYDFGSILC